MYFMLFQILLQCPTFNCANIYRTNQNIAVNNLRAKIFRNNEGLNVTNVSNRRIIGNICNINKYMYITISRFGFQEFTRN